MNCPACGTKNKANASFCIECGEPLELNNAPELGNAILAATAIGNQAVPQAEAAPNRGPFGGTPDSRPPDTLPFPISMIGWIPRPFNPLYWGWEIRLTVLALLVALFTDWLIQGNARNETADYQRGLKAYQAQQWHEAARLLAPLAQKDYQQAKTYYAEASQKVTDFNAYYSQAQTARTNGSLIRAALNYRNAYQIEPAYGDVATWLTDTLATAGQILYQKPDGLYLADVTGKPRAALPNSNKDSWMLALSDDRRWLAYTGSDTNQRKVYVRDMISGATESFADLPVTDTYRPSQAGYNYAKFINGGKGLLLISSADQQYNYRLRYFDIAANAALRELGDATAFADPDYRDIQIYFAPAASDTQPTWRSNQMGNVEQDGSSLVSYNVDNDSATLISNQLDRIGNIQLGNQHGPNRALFFVTKQGNSSKVYSKMLAPSNADKLLLSVTDNNGSAPYSSIFLSTSPTSEQAIAVRLDTTQEQAAWLLQAREGKATDLRDTSWGLVIPTLGYVRYSPNGSKVLVQGYMDKNNGKNWYAVVNTNLDLNIRGDWVNRSDGLAEWLGDSSDYFYTISNNGFSILDVSSGKTLVHVGIDMNRRSRSEGLLSLPYKNTLMYAANEGIFISDVDGRNPAFLIPDATAAWLIPAVDSRR